MSEKTHEPAVDDVFPEIRRVDLAAPGRWLKAGWNDLCRAGGASLFYGSCFAAGGWLMGIVFAHSYALFAGLVSGFLLVAPVLAMGLYELSRRIERGEAPALAPTLTAWRPNLPNIAILAAVLAVVLLIWARASAVIFALFFEIGALPTFADVVQAIVTFQQMEFSAVYFLVGGFFALFVFAISVIAVPLMLDRGTDAVTAGLASIGACARNPGPMLLWAVAIVLLVAFGMATWFLGLIVVMPLLGHATWHAYRDLMAPAELAGPGNSGRQLDSKEA